MSTDHDDLDDDDPEVLTGDQLLEREQSLQNQRKEFVLEYEDGAVARFEFKMLTEAELDSIEDEATTLKPSRTGDSDVEIDRQKLRTELIIAGVTSAPEGLKLTRRNVEQLSRDTRERLADAIENFAEMDQETRQRFR